MLPAKLPPSHIERLEASTSAFANGMLAANARRLLLPRPEVTVPVWTLIAAFVVASEVPCAEPTPGPMYCILLEPSRLITALLKPLGPQNCVCPLTTLVLPVVPSNWVIAYPFGLVLVWRWTVIWTPVLVTVPLSPVAMDQVTSDPLAIPSEIETPPPFMSVLFM